jgi:hypothetical protein
MEPRSNMNSLVGEYSAVLATSSIVSKESIQGLLVRDCAWSPQAATHLVQLATGYGSFMLRNALAISLALGVEDGDLGF